MDRDDGAAPQRRRRLLIHRQSYARGSSSFITYEWASECRLLCPPTHARRRLGTRHLLNDADWSARQQKALNVLITPLPPSTCGCGLCLALSVPRPRARGDGSRSHGLSPPWPRSQHPYRIIGLEDVLVLEFPRNQQGHWCKDNF